MKKAIQIFIILTATSFFSSLYLNTNAAEKEEQPIFTNQGLLDSIFQKLYKLEKGELNQINIVHLGDSHIQADFFTNAIRSNLQAYFGNAGYGFTFPYNLARTNGNRSIKYTSNAVWQAKFNVSPAIYTPTIGLSGIDLSTTDKGFKIQLTAEDHPFKTIKVIYPDTIPPYHFSLTDNPSPDVVIETTVERPKPQTHKIKKGEVLSTIARKYKTTVKKLKSENKLKSDRIQAGKVLKIPTYSGIEKTTRKIITESKDYLKIQDSLYYSSYTSSELLNTISLFSQGKSSVHQVSGLVLENGNKGLIYHSIGVNGAKFSDFNKHPLFFEQLPILKPDLVILSFGTNESFQKLAPELFIEKMRETMDLIRKTNPNVTFLVMSSPPSLLRRRFSNTTVKQYSEALNQLDNIIVWDLYSKMNGEAGIQRKGEFYNKIARDKIHYTTEGYEIQGAMFALDFLEAYNQFKQRQEIEPDIRNTEQ